MTLVLDTDAYHRMWKEAPEQAQALDRWLDAEDLVDMWVTAICFDGEGTALVTHCLLDDDGHPVPDDSGEVFLEVTDRVTTLRSLPPIDLARWASVA